MRCNGGFLHVIPPFTKQRFRLPFFEELLKIFIDVQNIFCFNFLGYAPIGWLAHQYKFQDIEGGITVHAPCDRKDFSVVKVTTYFGALIYLLVSHTLSHAQTVQLPAAEEFSTGEIVKSTTAMGEYFVKGTYGAWTLRCLKTEQQQDLCQLFQLMHTPDGVPVAEYNLNPIQSDGRVVAGANVITPLETLLTQQLTIQVDDNNAKIYPFAFCVQMGCVARIGLTQDDLDSYRAGAQATITMFPAAAPTQPERLTLSLQGFTSGHAALMDGTTN